MESTNYLNNLSILIVEDETDARRFLKQILFTKCNEVKDAEDGEKALEIYKQRDFDIVISDIRMPNVDGVSLAREILKINPKQFMIIVSAHSDSESIIELLNIGIEKFLLKPLYPLKLLKILKEIAKIIYSDNLIKKQKIELENINEELKNKNEKLKKVIRIFETKIKQSNLIKISTPACKSTEPVKKVKKDEFKQVHIKESILDDHIQELIELEGEIDASTSIMFLKAKLTEKELNKSIYCLERYGQLLGSYPIFSNLGDSILILSKELSKDREIDEKTQRNVLQYLESLVFTLIKWRREIFGERMENPNKYDNSISCDVDTIVLTLENKLEDIDGDIEFF